MNEKLEKLNRQKTAAEKKLIAAQHREKQLEHERKRLTRSERTHRLRRSCGKGQQHPDHLRPQSGKDACHRGQLPWPRRIRYPLLFIIQKIL